VPRCSRKARVLPSDVGSVERASLRFHLQKMPDDGLTAPVAMAPDVFRIDTRSKHRHVPGAEEPQDRPVEGTIVTKNCSMVQGQAFGLTPTDRP